MFKNNLAAAIQALKKGNVKTFRVHLEKNECNFIDVTAKDQQEAEEKVANDLLNNTQGLGNEWTIQEVEELDEK